MSLIITSGYGATGSASGFIATEIVGANRTITISFDLGFPPTALTGASAVAANWILTGPGNLVITNVAIVGVQVVLTITSGFIEPVGDYALAMPAGIVSGLYAYVGLTTLEFVGETQLPVMLAVNVIDARTLEIVFNNDMVEAEASNPANYSISPGLEIDSVEVVSATTYRITTARQTRSLGYNLTAAGMHDIYGNVV